MREAQIGDLLDRSVQWYLVNVNRIRSAAIAAYQSNIKSKEPKVRITNIALRSLFSFWELHKEWECGLLHS